MEPMAPLMNELVDAPVVDAVLTGELGYWRAAVVADYYSVHLSFG